MLEGKTSYGRATIAQLQINASDLVAIRQLLSTLGLFPETGAAKS